MRSNVLCFQAEEPRMTCNDEPSNDVLRGDVGMVTKKDHKQDCRGFGVTMNEDRGSTKVGTVYKEDRAW